MTLKEKVDEAIRMSNGTMFVTVLVDNAAEKKQANALLKGRRKAGTVDVQTFAEAKAQHDRLAVDSGVRPQHTFDPDVEAAQPRTLRPHVKPVVTVMDTPAKVDARIAEVDLTKRVSRNLSPEEKHEIAKAKRRARNAMRNQ